MKLTEFKSIYFQKFAMHYLNAIMSFFLIGHCKMFILTDIIRRNDMMKNI